MSNPTHLAKLNEGRQAWNDWRAANPNIPPNLKDAVLPDNDFSGFNLSGVLFDRTDLRCCFLNDIDFSGASLVDTNMLGVQMGNVDFTGSILIRTSFERAKMEKTNFSGCNCTDALFVDSVMFDTEFAAAVVNGLNMGQSIVANLRTSAAQEAQINSLGRRRIR